MAWQGACCGEAELKQVPAGAAGLYSDSEPVPAPRIAAPGEVEKLKENNNGNNNNIRNPDVGAALAPPTWLTVHEIELIGVIDHTALAPERTGSTVDQWKWSWWCCRWW